MWGYNSSQEPIIIKVKPPTINDYNNHHEITIKWLKIWCDLDEKRRNPMRKLFSHRMVFVLPMDRMTLYEINVHDKMQRSVIEDLKRNLTVLPKSDADVDNDTNFNYYEVNPEDRSTFPDVSVLKVLNTGDQRLKTAVWLQRWVALAELRDRIFQQTSNPFSSIRFTMKKFVGLENQKNAIADIEQCLFLKTDPAILPVIHSQVQDEKTIPLQLKRRLHLLPIRKANSVRSADPRRLISDMNPVGFYISYAQTSRNKKYDSI